MRESYSEISNTVFAKRKRRKKIAKASRRRNRRS
jgi:hypothetical protein